LFFVVIDWLWEFERQLEGSRIHAKPKHRAHHRRHRIPGKLQSPTMPASSPIDQIAERVERLLVRHEEVQRTNALLQEQVDALTRERDALKSRLAAARTRLDALLERLPADPPSQDSPA
jgi:FtsZ-binding cell division protein ZapB